MVQPTHMCLGRLSLCVQTGAMAAELRRLLALQPRLAELGEFYGCDGRRDVDDRSLEREMLVQMHVCEIVSDE